MAKKKGDISKQLYKFQESITAVALETTGIPVNEIHWPVNARPKGLTVDVDVLVGTSPENAKTNISVKHMTSNKESEKGGWRMMREIIDSKVNCDNIKIYNVFFDSSLKNDWAVIVESFFDGVLSVEQHDDFGRVLIEKAYSYTKGVLRTKGDEDTRRYLRRIINKKEGSYDKELSTATRKFGESLASKINNPPKDLEEFWAIVRKASIRGYENKTPRVTCFKRGLAKFLILDSESRSKVYNHYESSTTIEELPIYALELGLATEDILGEWEIEDADIINLFELFPSGQRKTFESIYEKSPVDRMNEKYINPLRQAANVKAFNQYIYDNYALLVTKKGMKDALGSCFKDPMACIADYKIDGVENVHWLFLTLMALLKEVGGTSQSYGLSLLAEDSGHPEIASLGGLIITPFVNLEKPLDAATMNDVSTALADRLKAIEAHSILDMYESVLKRYKQRIVETQLVPYRMFDPLSILLTAKLDQAGLNWEQHKRYLTAAREHAGTAGGGSTKALEVHGAKGALILWQSPNRNARDKAKEFSARIACLLAKYDANKKKFVKRGLDVYMVVDGVWSEEDLDSLMRFGCKGLYYPDELDVLVNQLSG